MSKELPRYIEFIPSETMPGYGYVAPVLGMIAVEETVGRRLVRGWNAVNRLIEMIQGNDNTPCFACKNFDVIQNDFIDREICINCMKNSAKNFKQV